MSSLPHTEKQGRAVDVPGIGIRTTAHLNLTRTLADVWDIKPELPAAKPPRKKPGRKPRVSQEPTRLPAAGTTYRYFLRDEEGHYLHESADGMTSDRKYAWRGSGAHLTKLRERKPALNSMRAEVVF